MKLNDSPLLSIVMTLVSLAGIASAVTIGQFDNFEDGSLQNWTQGINNGLLSNGSATPTSSLGLFVETTGNTTGPGHNLVVFNSTQWAGDYLAAGVTGIEFDALAGTLDDHFVRVAIDGAGGRFVTTDIFITAPAAPFPSPISFSLAPQDLTAVGGTDVMATLADVTQLRILHNPVAAFEGETVGADPLSPVVGQLFVDNITAVPEPNSLVAMLPAAFAGLLFVLRGRWRKSN